MKEPDQEELIKAIVMEINGHVEGDHWELVRKADAPKGTKILDSVWAFKQKRDIKTQEVLKYKAWLNMHGGQQQYGMPYFDTYAPVVTWSSARMAFILSIINQGETCQIDFVMAYPHANTECDLYIKLPFGVEAVDET
eukprot:4678576-Ditylum_brightwellii.AAC.1